MPRLLCIVTFLVCQEHLGNCMDSLNIGELSPTMHPPRNMSLNVKDDDTTGRQAWILHLMLAKKRNRRTKRFETGYVAPAPCIYNCGRCPGGEVWSPFTKRCVGRRFFM